MSVSAQTDHDLPFVKSPLNYTGGKFKLLGNLVPLFEDASSLGSNIFVDVFGGGGNVIANAPLTYTEFIYNDVIEQVEEMLKTTAQKSFADIDKTIKDYVLQYGLDRDNKDGYLKLRSAYNAIPASQRTAEMFFTIVAHSFSNQIRFNGKGEFNLPFGKRTYNGKMRSNLESFCSAMNARSPIFTLGDFRNLDELLGKYEPASILLYCDPPYLNSVATYNEKNGWTEQDEQALLDWLDAWAAKGARFVLSNNLKYGNLLLEEWMGKYKVTELDMDYSNSNYHKKERGGDREVAVRNFSK